MKTNLDVNIISGKMSFRTKQLTEEEMKSEHMPDWYRCDGCLAVSYVLHTVFEEKHKNRHKNWKLDEASIIEEVGNYSIFKLFTQLTCYLSLRNIPNPNCMRILISWTA